MVNYLSTESDILQLHAPTVCLGHCLLKVLVSAFQKWFAAQTVTHCDNRLLYGV